MEFPPEKELMHSFPGKANFLNRYSPRFVDFPLLSDNYVDYMLIINLIQNITNLSMP